jgi:hypothetical protein
LASQSRLLREIWPLLALGPLLMSDVFFIMIAVLIVGVLIGFGLRSLW